MLASLSERRRSRSFEKSPYMVNHVEEWRERLDTWPRVTMENLAKQSVTDEQEGEKMILSFRRGMNISVHRPLSSRGRALLGLVGKVGSSWVYS